jgi:hypothetical protein
MPLTVSLFFLTFEFSAAAPIDVPWGVRANGTTFRSFAFPLFGMLVARMVVWEISF